jgi:hypothetical protein
MTGYLEPVIDRCAIRICDDGKYRFDYLTYSSTKEYLFEGDLYCLKVVKVYPNKNNPNYKKLINDYPNVNTQPS